MVSTSFRASVGTLLRQVRNKPLPTQVLQEPESRGKPLPKLPFEGQSGAKNELSESHKLEIISTVTAHMQEDSEKAPSKGKPLREQAAQWLDEAKEIAAAQQHQGDPAKNYKVLKILNKHADLEINYDTDFQNKNAKAPAPQTVFRQIL